MIEAADSTPPVLTVNEELPTVFDQFSTATVDLKSYISANDDVDGNIVVTDEMIDKAGFSLDKAGTYNVKYTVKDLSNNESTKTIVFTVNDKQAPEVKAVDKKFLIGDKYYPLLTKVVDNIDGTIVLTSANLNDLSAFLNAENSLTVAGVHQVTFTVKDAADNETIKTINITVIDKVLDEVNKVNLLALENAVENDGGAESTGVYENNELVVTYHGVKGWYASYSKLKYYDVAVTQGTYKMVIEGKAEALRDIMIYFVGENGVKIEGFDETNGKKIVTLSEDYAVIEFVFDITIAGPYVMEIHFGWEGYLTNASNPNVMTFKQIALIPAIANE